MGVSRRVDDWQSPLDGVLNEGSGGGGNVGGLGDGDEVTGVLFAQERGVVPAVLVEVVVRDEVSLLDVLHPHDALEAGDLVHEGVPVGRGIGVGIFGVVEHDGIGDGVVVCLGEDGAHDSVAIRDAHIIAVARILCPVDGSGVVIIVRAAY